MNSIKNTSFNKQENKKEENLFNKKYYSLDFCFF